MTHPVTKARRLRKLKQVDLAEMCGFARSTICRIEKGERGSIETFRQIGRALGIDYRLLMPEEHTR